jgi:hypothetical protein
MFKLALSPTYTTQISGILPGGHRFNFEIEYERLSQADVEDVAKGSEAGVIVFADICRRVVTGWKGVQDNDGEIPFSAAALERVLSIHPLSKYIYEAWMASLEKAHGA